MSSGTSDQTYFYTTDVNPPNGVIYKDGSPTNPNLGYTATFNSPGAFYTYQPSTYTLHSLNSVTGKDTIIATKVVSFALTSDGYIGLEFKPDIINIGKSQGLVYQFGNYDIKFDNQAGYNINFAVYNIDNQSIVQQGTFTALAKNFGIDYLSAISDGHGATGLSYPTGSADDGTISYVQFFGNNKSDLFSTTSDNVDFNNLTASQQKSIASGSQPPYDGKGGGDTITLPDANHFNMPVASGQTLHWTNSTVFTTSSQSGDVTTVNVPLGQPSSVAYHVVLGDGTDTVNMASQGGALIVDAGHGNAVLNLSGSGKTTLNVAPGSGSSAGTETVSVAALAPDGQLGIHFTGNNENIKIIGADLFKGKIHVSGMTVGSGNSITFDTPDLNSGVVYGNNVATYTKAEDLYATPRGQPELYLTGPGADHHTATLVFDDGDINQVKPQTDGATTKLVVESSTAARTTPAGSGSIDWNFIRAEERYELQPYVPGATSGVTIGSGVDLAKGPVTRSVIQGLFSSEVGTNPNLAYIYDQSHDPGSIGPVGDTAKASLGFDHTPFYSHTISLTVSEVNRLSNTAEEALLTVAKSKLSNFDTLPAKIAAGVQTLVFDQVYNTGTVRAGLSAALATAISHVDAAHPYGLQADWANVETAIDATPVSADRKANEKTQLIDPILNKAAPLVVSSRVVDGYVAGATVFADANNNGRLDAGEASTTTDATGGFSLISGTGPLVATGGTDISTGLALTTALRAPAGATVISPLTTLVADVGAANAAQVLTALGLPAGTDVTTLDPVAAAQGGDPSAYLASVKLYSAAALVGAVGGGTPANGFATIETLLSSATAPVNLGDPATIATLLASRPGLDAATATKLATAIAGTIGSIDTAAQGKSGDALITAASAVERVAEGVMTSTLAAAGTSLTALAAAADSYTGQHLTDAITLAATQLPGSTSGSGGTGSGGTGSGGAGSGGSGGSVGGGSGGSGSTGDLPTAGVGSGTSGDPGTGGSNLPSLSTLVHDATAPAGQAYALYHGLLGRAPDTAGLQALTIALANGTSPHDAAQALLASPEGQSHLSAADNAGFVAQLYQSVLGRAPDSAGLANATAALDHGLSRADLADSLVFSPEHLGQLQSAFTAGISVPDPHAVSVAQAYYSLLGRAPDASGLQAFGNASLHDVAEGLMHSTEYASLTGMTSDTAYVAELYQHLLGRAADSAGAQTWTAALAGGANRAGVANALLDSAEFQGHYAGQSSAAYVEALYQHVLGRPGDTAGVQTWANALDHGASRTDVAHAFTASSEFQALAGGQSDAAFVEGLYTHALGRSADAAGEQAWLSALAHGASRADVVAGLMQSAEGQAHLTAQIAHDWHLV